MCLQLKRQVILIYVSADAAASALGYPCTELAPRLMCWYQGVLEDIIKKTSAFDPDYTVIARRRVLCEADLNYVGSAACAAELYEYHYCIQLPS